MSQLKNVVEDLTFRFKVSGNLIKKLGEESIANKNIAGFCQTSPPFVRYPHRFRWVFTTWTVIEFSS